jgi:hypothetical protein
MTIWDGHGRTPHDGLENFISSVAMLFCLPCLCVVACSKIKLPTHRRKGKPKEEPIETQIDAVFSKPIEKSPENEAALAQI